MFLKETRERIEQQFAAFTAKFQNAGKEILEKIEGEAEETALLLKYLYSKYAVW